MRAGQGTVEGTFELGDKVVENLSIQKVGLGEGGIDEGAKNDRNISKTSLESEEERLMLSDQDDTDEEVLKIFPTPNGDDRVAGQDVARGLEGQNGQREVDDWPNVDTNPLMPPQVGVLAGRPKKAKVRAVDEQQLPY